MPPDPENRTFPRGSVVRISLTDFLTYDKVEVKPAPGLNLLIGPNGTGKSTMVCALCLGLAGSPEVLGRSARLFDYIKTGKSEAIIEIELSSGDSTRNPVIRTMIRPNKPRTADYYVNAQKMDQERVRDFVRGYHIQVDNLCQFLAQDKVVEFARQSKQELLINTEKAAGSNDLYERHQKLKKAYEEGAQLRQELSAIANRKESLERILATLEKPFRQYEEYQKRKEKLELLRKKRHVVEYEMMLEESQQVKERLEAAKDEYKKCVQKAAPLHEKITKARDESRKVDRAFEEEKRRFAQAEAEITRDMDAITRLSTQMDNANATLRTMKEEFEAKQGRITSAESAIATLREKLRTASDQDVTSQLERNERERRGVNRQLDELEPRATQIEGSLKAEDLTSARLNQQLNSLQNQQQQQLQQVKSIDSAAYDAYSWYLKNRTKFRGSVWLPAVDMRIPNRNDIKFVEACIGKRDLFALIFEHFEDMQAFLDEMKRQNIRVAAGEVPQNDIAVDVPVPESLRRLGFRDFVCNMIDAPHGLKKYLTNLSQLNKILVGTDQTERNLEEVTNAVRALHIRKYLTPTKVLSVSESRYGGGATVLNQGLSEPRLLNRTIASGDERQATQLREQLARSENEISRLKTSLTQINNNLREVRRRLTELEQEMTNLRQSANQRTSLQTQLEFKERQLRQLMQESPDMAEEEKKHKDKMKRATEERIRLSKKIVNLTETIEQALCEWSKLSVERMVYSANAVECQRQLSEISEATEQHRERMERLQLEYNEKRSNVMSLLGRVRQVLGLPPGPDNRIPAAALAPLQEFPDDLEPLDDMIEEQVALLEHTQGAHDHDRNIVEQYKGRQADLHRAILEETRKQDALTNWETDISAQREEWLPELNELIATISRNFSLFMSKLGCAGEVQLDIPEDQNDFTEYGVRINVKFRDNEPLRELDPQHQSGGERSVSTMLYMLALQELSHVPFRCIDEINQGMDPINERKVFEMMTKLLSGDSGLKCTQYFMLTPKLLHGLSMGEDISVWVIHNGPKMLPNNVWKPEKFLERKRALNLAAAQ